MLRILIKVKNGTMKKISEIDLHLYVVNKSLLAYETVHDIEQRIIFDKKLADDIEEIKEYYQNFETYNIEDELKIFKLVPLNTGILTGAKLTLAAQQTTATSPGLKYIKTFISGEKYVLIRMFHDPINKEYEFYVLCENEALVKNAVIKILSINLEIKTNENGFAKISAEYIPDDAELTVILN